MAWRMTGACDRCDAGSILLVRVIWGHFTAEGIEYPACILEVAFENGVSRPLAHLAVVHPEFPLHGRHHDLGIWIGGLVVGGLKSIFMIAHGMWNFYHFYLFCVDAP